MTRKHFKLIAEALANLPFGATRQQVAEAFADALAQTNPAFDRKRFLAACGVA